MTAYASPVPGYRLSRLTSPGRTVVRASTGAWLATLTDGSRTVTLVGPERTFSEASTPERVATRTWVRLLRTPFAGTVDVAWLTEALADGSPDVLAIAMQYVDGAPPMVSEQGLRYRGNASYGPLLANGDRAAGSDFNDYLGVTWTYPDRSSDAPDTTAYGSLDCSGFVRMVFGYRAGLPLSLRPDGRSLPRRAFEQLASAPGQVILPNTGVAPPDRSLLQPGDLVFFNASPEDGPRIDHVGIYLGRDTGGHERFISSRKGADGPTLGDIRGRSILDGTGLYASAFRAARRM